MPMTIPSIITPEEKAKWREEALGCGPVLHLLNALESTEYELEKLKTRYHHLWCEEANTTLEMCGLKEKLDASEKEVRKLETALKDLMDMQVAQVIPIISFFFAGISNGIKQQNSIRVNIACLYCDATFDNSEDAKAHGATCKNHPALIRAETAELRAEKAEKYNRQCVAIATEQADAAEQMRNLAAIRQKEIERLTLDFMNLKMTTYDQAHSAGANLGYNNCREEMQPLLDKAEARAERLGRVYNLVMMELNSSHARIHGIDEAHADPERLK